MNDLEKVLKSAKSISSDIEDLLKQSTYNDFDDLSGLKIDYLNKPIKYVGTLQKNNNGRYEANREYTCGSGIEVLVYDDFDESERWIKTSVEHNGKDYYLVGYKNIPMEGLTVRVRES